MKIISGKYPEEKDIDKWLNFKGDCNIVMLWRAAAYARDMVKKQCSGFGGRTTAEQQALYNAYLAGTGNLAAKPGTSWHEYGFALDFNGVNGVYPGTFNADYANWIAGKPETLNAYGLMHAVKGEIWHIQPIETKNYTGDKKLFADVDDYKESDMATIAELTAQIKTLTTNNTTLRTALDAERRLTKQLHSDKFDLTSQLISCHQKEVILTNEIKSLKAQITSQTAEIVRLTGLVKADVVQDADTRNRLQKIIDGFK